jgi:hypothetical protein
MDPYLCLGSKGVQAARVLLHFIIPTEVQFCLVGSLYDNWQL